ncbi:MAG TPA: HK97 family phage prohead protease, partial [Nitrosopumilaceae archaeon]|nr:HK97 family phage prohead protease [Nitrosopumilaceae archaeon]
MKDFTHKVDKEMTFPLSIKAIDDTGKFEGYASTFGNQDSQGDVVVKGAFKKTIGIRKGKWPILWQHSSAQPVGVNVAAEEDDKGLKVAGEINVTSDDGKKAHDWMKFAMDRDLPVGLSIGFRIREKDTVGGIRYLKEIQLVEYSIVTFPANEEANVTGVKSVTNEDVTKAMDFNEAL